MIYGYARVSTDGQTLEGQVKQLRANGATSIVRETASGARADRAGLARVIAKLATGDVLMVTRLDRLARSTRDLLNILAKITEAGADFRSLGEPTADTTTPMGEAFVTMIGLFATFERSLILSRTKEGRDRAMAAGKKFGRKAKLTEHQRREAIERRDARKESAVAIARSYNVSRQTIGRLAS